MRACRWGRTRPVTSDSAQHRHVAPRQHEPAVDGGDHDPGAGRREVVVRPGHRHEQALPGQQPGQPVGGTGGRGAQHHRVARPGQRADLSGQAGPVAQDRLPPPALDQGHVGPLGRGHEGHHGGVRPGEEPVEGRVQPRGVDPVLESPGVGQGVGQGGLLVEQLRRPVADPAGLDQHHLGVVAQQVGQEFLGVDQPGQPRLHAVELLAVGDAVPLVTAPRGRGHQPGRTFPHGRVGHQLAAAEELHGGDRLGGPLVGDVEAGQPVDLVPPQVDAHGLVGRRREDVDDPATDGQLAAVLDHGLAPVAQRHQLGHQVVHHHPVTLGHDHRARRRAPRAEALEHGLDRGHHQVGNRRAAATSERPQQPQAAAHGVDLGAHPLERQGLPGGEQLDHRRASRSVAVVRPAGDEGPEVVGELGGGRARGGDHQHRTPGTEPDQAGQHERLRRGGDGEGGAARAHDPGHGGLVAEQCGQ